MMEGLGMLVSGDAGEVRQVAVSSVMMLGMLIKWLRLVIMERLVMFVSGDASELVLFVTSPRVGDANGDDKSYWVGDVHC